jgi:hypothetical protein
MSEISIRLIILGATLVFLALIGSCQMTKARIAQAIENGADPVAAKCALQADSSYLCNNYLHSRSAPVK